MELPLDATECRILGVLLEKQLATPEYYPLTVNALIAACNQKSARRPVTHLQEFEVEGALRALFQKRWASNTDLHGRTLRWFHRVEEAWGLDRPARAVLAELLLRGPQQPGELRANAARLAPAELASQEVLEQTLDRLSAMVPAVVRRLARRPGERADRWAHLLSGEPAEPAGDPGVRSPLGPGSAEVRGAAAGDSGLEARVERLESEVAVLREIVEVLRRGTIVN